MTDLMPNQSRSCSFRESRARQTTGFRQPFILLGRYASSLSLAPTTLTSLLVISIMLCFFGCHAFGKLENNRQKADKVIIEKGKRRMALLSKGREIRVYKIVLGRSPKGPKTKKGDKKTPEGVYRIISRNRHSRYHLALKISYPNSKDLQHAKQESLNPGGDIMIHGIKNGLGWVGRLHRLLDWTQGCIAVTNEEMEGIWDLVPIGTTVEIRP